MSQSAFKTYLNNATKLVKEKSEARGEALGKSAGIIRLLRYRFGELPVRLENKIKGVQSLDKLDELLDFASSCVSIGEFSTALN